MLCVSLITCGIYVSDNGAVHPHNNYDVKLNVSGATFCLSALNFIWLYLHWTWPTLPLTLKPTQSWLFSICATFIFFLGCCWSSHFLQSLQAFDVSSFPPPLNLRTHLNWVHPIKFPPIALSLPIAMVKRHWELNRICPVLVTLCSLG